jgi:membrane-bound lytic murein transglycosylase D
MYGLSTRALFTTLIFIFAILSGCAYVSHSTANDLEAQELARTQSQTLSIWVPIKEGFALAPLETPLVGRQINLYTASGTHLQDTLNLARPYLYFILEEVKKRDMPTELVLLPFLESSFNVRRGNGLNPAGLWGLMPIAARHLQLAQTPFKDERRDIIRSTEAALDLLQELYEKFGDWHIALAAYNWGPGNMTRAIANNKRRKLPTNYQSLNMPIETMVFVPKLLALRKIIENPGTYKIDLPAIPNKPYFVKLPVPRAIDISVVTRLAEISHDEFIELNPSFNKSVIPAGKNQSLLLPVSQIERFEKNYQQYDAPLSQWRSVFVEQPQSLEAFARSFKVDPNRTRQINGLRLGVKLQAGMMLVIPKPTLKDD